jgi:hypothetical protein
VFAQAAGKQAEGCVGLDDDVTEKDYLDDFLMNVCYIEFNRIETSTITMCTPSTFYKPTCN